MKKRGKKINQACIAFSSNTNYFGTLDKLNWFDPYRTTADNKVID